MDNATKVGILTNARRAINSSHNWVRKGLAQDADGKPAFPKAEKAARFSILGAIYQVCHPNDDPLDLAGLYSLLATYITGDRFFNIGAFEKNPQTTHKDVLRLFDCAIADLA